MIHIIIGGIILIGASILAHKSNEKIIKILSIFIILNKGIEILIAILFMRRLSKIPVEYSTLTYFLLPIAVLLNNKSLIKIFAFMGILSGLGFLLVFTIMGSVIYQLNGLYGITQGLINHSIVYVIGTYYLQEEPMQSVKSYIWVVTLMMVLYMFAVISVIDYGREHLFIRDVLAGKVVVEKLDTVLNGYGKFVYYPLLVVVYHLLILVYIKLNKVFYSTTTKTTVEGELENEKRLLD